MLLTTLSSQGKNFHSNLIELHTVLAPYYKTVLVKKKRVQNSSRFKTISAEKQPLFENVYDPCLKCSLLEEDCGFSKMMTDYV